MYLCYVYFLCICLIGVAAVQRADGSFSASIDGNEHDMRFVYCASAICAMLDDWGTVNKKSMAQYIQNSLVCFHRIIYIVAKKFNIYLFSVTTLVWVNTTIWNPMVEQHFVPYLLYN